MEVDLPAAMEKKISVLSQGKLVSPRSPSFDLANLKPEVQIEYFALVRIT